MALHVSLTEFQTKITNLWPLPSGLSFQVNLAIEPVPENIKVDFLVLSISEVGNPNNVIREIVGNSWNTTMAQEDDTKAAEGLKAELVNWLKDKGAKVI